MNLKYFCDDHSWQIDIDTGRVYCNGHSHGLRPSSEKVIRYLATNPNQLCSYEKLYGLMKGEDASRIPGDAINDLFKQDINTCPKFKDPKLIHKIKGKGICFTPYNDVVLRLLVDRDKASDPNMVALIEGFCGRADDLQWLMEHAFLDSNLLVLSGAPGIGKTELAKAFVHRCIESDVSARLYYDKVIWTGFDQSIRHTIGSLPCDSLAPTNFERSIEALTALPGRKLLVIDNADPANREEFSWNNPDMRALLGTGCDVLMTSKFDLRGYNPSLRQYTVPPITPEELTRLFINKADGWVAADQAEEVKDLIENYLHCNTYLTVLTAGVADWHDISEIKASLKAMKVAEMKGTGVSVLKDGTRSEHLPLFAHFQHLFGIAKLSAQQKILLLHLALLPVDGVPIKWLLDHAFDESGIEQVRSDLNLLKEHYFCFVERRNGQPWVRIQPMLREVILRDKWAPNDRRYISAYVTSLIQKLDRPHYHPETPDVLRASAAAAAGLSIMKEGFLSGGNVPLYTQLLCQIVSVYEILKNYSAVREYADEAGRWLDKIRPKNWTLEDHRDDILLYLTACNNLAYPLCHVGKLELSRDYFSMALDVIKLLDRERLVKDTELSVRASKLYNNLGANYLQAKQYEMALTIHQEVLKFRRQLADEGAPDALALVAASHKSVGTDLYYLKRYGEAFEHHEKAVALYMQEFGPESLDYVTAWNRMIGAGILSENQQALYKEWMEQLHRNLIFLRGIAFVKDEVCNCIRHAATLVKLQPALRVLGREILQEAKAFEQKHSELTQAIETLENTL